MESIRKLRFWLAAAVVATVVLAATGGVAYALTPAGTIIGNTATATYSDAANNDYTSTSNIVQTTVTAICYVDVTPDAGVIKSAVPTQTVNLKYDVTNNGNTDFTFELTIVEDGGGGDAADYVKNIYLDDNGNGIADPGESLITTWDGSAVTYPGAGTPGTITLAMDETKSIVVQVSVPVSATDGTTDLFSLSADTNPSGCSDTAAGTVTVTTDALIEANKSVDTQNTVPGATLTYDISFQNVGLTSAKARDGWSVDYDDSGTPTAGVEGILVEDAIPAGAYFNYTGIPGNDDTASGSPGSNPTGYVVYSDDGTNWYRSLSNLPTGPVTHIGYFLQDANPTGDTNEDVLSVNQAGSFSFTVTVSDPFTELDGCVDNYASIYYRNSTDTTDLTTTTNTTTSCVPPQDQADIAIGGLDGWSYGGGAWTTANVDPSAEEDSTGDYTDDNYATDMSLGIWYTFRHRAANNSTADDVINLEVELADSSLPAGAIVQLWNSNGSALLFDNNGDSTDDVGNVTAGNYKDFTVKVFIPAGTTTLAADGTVDWWVTILATSANNVAEVDRSRDNIDGYIGAGVDVAAINAGTETGGDGNVGNDDPADGNIDGTADSDDATPAVAIDPGSTATWTFQVVNTGGQSDSYNLLLGAAGDSPPAGSVVKFFRDTDCDGIGDTETTNTNLLGGTRVVADLGAGVLEVTSVANLSVNDNVYIGLDGVERTITAVSAANKTITVNPAATPSAGDEVSESKCYTLTITTQSTAPPGTDYLRIEATSASTGSSDDIDAVLTVNQLCYISLISDGSDSIPPNGSSSYIHTVTNLSNYSTLVQITVPVLGSESLSYSLQADTDGNGTPEIYSVGDPYAVGPPAVGFQVMLTQGESFPFTVSVQAPSNVTEGDVESITVKAVAVTGACQDTVTDTTTIIEGFLQLTKYVDKTTAQPGETLTYRIMYQNIGSNTAYNVVITDQIPQYTVFAGDNATDGADFCLDTNNDGTCDTQYTKGSGDDQAEYDGGNTLVRFRVGTGADSSSGGSLAPGESGSIIFQVIIE